MANTKEMTYEEIEKNYSGDADPTIFFFAVLDQAARESGEYLPDNGYARAPKEKVDKKLLAIFEYFIANHMVTGKEENGDYYYTL